MTAALALDTSVAVPLLVRTHEAHAAVVRWWAHRRVALCGHAVVETYSVLTRLPADLRLAPADAARLLAERFAPPCSSAATRQGTSRKCSAGWASPVALSTTRWWPWPPSSTGADLGTRDARARETYEKTGARVILAV